MQHNNIKNQFNIIFIFQINWVIQINNYIILHTYCYNYDMQISEIIFRILVFVKINYFWCILFNLNILIFHKFFAYFFFDFLLSYF